MGYHVVNPEEESTLPDRPCETWDINSSDSDRDELEHLGVRIYKTQPGEQMPLKYHYHETQEEAFYVLSGTLSVETPERVYEIEEGGIFLVEPESPQRAFNPEDAAEEVKVLAMGAPTHDGGQLYEP